MNITVDNSEADEEDSKGSDGFIPVGTIVIIPAMVFAICWRWMWKKRSP